MWTDRARAVRYGRLGTGWFDMDGSARGVCCVEFAWAVRHRVVGTAVIGTAVISTGAIGAGRSALAVRDVTSALSEAHPVALGAVSRCLTPADRPDTCGNHRRPDEQHRRPDERGWSSVVDTRRQWNARTRPPGPQWERAYAPHSVRGGPVRLRGWCWPATVGSRSNKIDSVRRRAVTPTTALAVSEHGPYLPVQRNSVERERVRPDIGPSETRHGTDRREIDRAAVS